MTRRIILLGVLSPILAPSQQTQAEHLRELRQELADLMNEFVAQWNVASAMVIRGQNDTGKVTENLEKQFNAVVTHPAWLSRRKK